MSSNIRYRVGLVGTGFIADYHAEAVRHVPGATVVAICDTNRRRAEAFARPRGLSHVYESLQTMLDQQRLDVVHVLVPPDHHFAVANLALSAGAHVLLEKPMCADVADCGALLIQAERGGRCLGVNHNFLFHPAYEALRADVQAGRLGRLDHITITWNQELPQVRSGPFDIWMLRDPRNIMLEIGSHTVAHMLDLVGPPEQMTVSATNSIDLPGDQRFFRRWQVQGYRGPTAIDIRCSFIPGFVERTVHVRGTCGSAVADIERNTYTIQRNTKYAYDVDKYRVLTATAKALRKRARRNLANYILSKFGLSDDGNSFQASIVGSVRSFYQAIDGAADPRVSPELGRSVTAQCVRIGELAGLDRPAVPSFSLVPRRPTTRPRVLVLGGTGFIGAELVRQLAATGEPLRLMTRRRNGLPYEVNGSPVEVFTGDICNPQDLARAVEGVDYVYHLARANGGTWDDYYKQDVLGTQQLAECCLSQKVRRLVYTSTIACYYAGAKAGVITEKTPLDPSICRVNKYCRAKFLAEQALLEMSRRQDLPVVICRPGIVIGPGGDPCHFGVGSWRGIGTCQLWGTGRNMLPIVLVEDVVKGLLAAMTTEGIEGESFNLVDDPCLSGRDYLEAIERHAGIELQKIPTPAWRLYAIDTLKWAAKVLIRQDDRQLPSYRTWDSLACGGIFNCSKAKDVLHWRPTADKEKIIARGIYVSVAEFLA